jgi:hypothetical protein
MQGGIIGPVSAAMARAVANFCQSLTHMFHNKETSSGSALRQRLLNPSQLWGSPA